MAIQIQQLPQLISKYIPSRASKKSAEVSILHTIGLSIGRANIVVCELSSQAEKLALEHCLFKEIAKDKPLAAQVKELLQGMKFQTAKVNVSLKGQGVVVRFLSFPRMSRAEFASSIQYEAEKYLPFNLADVILDYHIINEAIPGSPEGANTMQVILVAARKTEIDKMLNLAREVGFKLNAIDVDIFAYTNAFQRANPDAKAHLVAVCDLGAVDTTLGILNKGVLVFSRDIAFGGNDLTEMIKRKLNVSLEEASKIQRQGQFTQADQMSAIEEGLDRLFQEVRSSFNYYYNQHENATPIEKIYISGGLSQMSLLPSLLEKRIEVPIEKWDPLSQITIRETASSNVKEILSYLPVGIGLALRQK